MSKDKKRLFIKGIILFVLGLILIYLYFIKDSKKETDAQKFKSEYTNVSKDNPFVYRDVDKIINILEKGSGVVYLGFPECPWCQAYVPYLNEVAKTNGLEKIYYFNILEDRKNNTDDYKEMVSILFDSLIQTELIDDLLDGYDILKAVKKKEMLLKIEDKLLLRFFANRLFGNVEIDDDLLINLSLTKPNVFIGYMLLKAMVHYLGDFI